MVVPQLSCAGDLGLMTCFNKQKRSCIRLISRLKRTEGDRLITTVSNWASRRRKGWHETVSGFINSIECADVVNNTQITVKTVMHLIKDKMKEQDNDEFATELFNDINQPNGNKLRTYRVYKENVNAGQFVLSNIPRSVRRTMAPFRTGALPLAVETGRYLNDRLCKLCDNSVVAHEQHVMMNCPLYSDIRFELIQNAKRLIVNCDCSWNRNLYLY